MQIATYDIPFSDFDYRPMVEACGAKFVSQTDSKLTVEGSHMAISSLSSDLDFAPSHIEAAPPPGK